MNARNFAVRLSVEGAQQAGAALRGVPAAAAEGVRQLGDASERAGRQTRGLRVDTTNVTPTMRALDVAVRDVRGEFDAFANRIPIVGGALAALGPAGTAAAAGVAAIALGFTAMLQNSRQAIEQLRALKLEADNVALSVEDFQAFRGVALIEGVDAQTTENMLSTLARNSARLSEGYGEMYEALRRVNPELAEQIALTTTQAERIDIVATAIQNATSYNDKLNIAVAAFGSEGARMIRVLDETGASMDTWRDRANAAGLVVEESLVAAAAEVGQRMELMAAQTDVAGQRLGVALAPANEALARTQANFMLGLTEILDGLKAIEDRSEYSLRVALNRRKQYQDTLLWDFSPVAKAQALYALSEMEEIERVLNARIEAARVASEAYSAEADPARTQLYDLHAAQQQEYAAERDRIRERDRIEAERRAAEAARLRLGYEREAIQLRAELGDITGLLAAREKELNAIVAANVGLTREMADDVMRRYRESLDGTAAAQARWAAVIDSSRSPLQRAYDELALLHHEFTQGLVSADAYRQAHAALTARLKETADAEAALGAEVEKTSNKYGEHTDELGRYGVRLREQRALSLEVQLGMAGIVGILDQQIETWEDAGQVALRVLRDIAVQAIYTAAQLEGASLASIVAAGFGVFFGGFGAPAQGVGDFKNASTPVLGGGGRKSAGVFHGGGVAGFATQTRIVPETVFYDAPRNHRGYPLGANERAAILEVGEPVVSRWDAGRIMSAVERSGGGGGGGVKINIHNHSGGEVETRERRGADGGREVDILIGRKMNSHTAGGGGDPAMRSRYGLTPALGR